MWDGVGTPRVSRGAGTTQDAHKYLRQARLSASIDAATTAWANGVDWDEAWAIAQKATDKSMPLPKAKARPKPKAKAKGLR